MFRRLIAITLVLGLAVLLPLGRGQAPAKKTAATPTDAETLAAGEYAGVLKSTPGTDRMFTVTTEQKKLVPVKGRNTGRAPRLAGYPHLNGSINRVYQAQSQYMKAATQAASAKNPKQLAKAQQNAAKAEAHLLQAAATLQQQALAAGIRNSNILLVQSAKSMPNFKIQTSQKDVDFQVTEEVKVRTMVLPDQFDEKGNLKKYTKAELAELKGKDKTLPGYESSLDKLEAGQRVKVTLAPSRKKKAAVDPNNPDKDKDKDQEKDKDNPDKKMQVKMILILAEADAAAKKGKKNN